MNSLIFNNADAKLLSLVFSKKVLRDLSCGKGESKKLNEIIKKTNILNLAEVSNIYDVFELFYKVLVSQYRNEYVYKNAIASKIVKGRHRFANTSFYSEFRVRDSIADCVIANGTTTAYEIKTEYDSFQRLDKQLNSYRKAFDKIFVVVPESKLKSSIDNISSDVGILILSDKYTLSEFRKPESQIANLSHEIVFDCLHKKEYEEIILREFGGLPVTKPYLVRAECKKLFSSLTKEKAHQEFFNCLKNRRSSILRKRLALSVPSSLVSLAITLDFSQRQHERLVHSLQTPF